MAEGHDTTNITGFRVLLAVGAGVSLVLGVWGLFFSGLLHSALGPKVNQNLPGYLAMARMYGAAMLALGIGYGLAATHPLRNRGLLVVLFAAPLAGSIALVIAAAKGEVSTAKGAVFAAADIAYCLLYFRLYPKPAVSDDKTAGEPEASAGPGSASPGRGDAEGPLGGPSSP